MSRYHSYSLNVENHSNVLETNPSAHIVWLRQRRQMGENAVRLQGGMKAQGLLLEVVDVFDATSSQLAGADLILLDAFDRVDGIVETIVARIRMESRVPLVMLTDGYSTEQLVTALTAGADAVWALNIPVEVLMARCKALLRRWMLNSVEKF
ncbi:MAG: response regulator transcription factor [Caldilineaceae bacterium]|nr:response regulator transcription factor [Caldilineaceae bacterium]